MEVTEECGGFSFRASPLVEFAPLPADELSLSSFVPLHFAPVGEVTLNGRAFSGEAVTIRTRNACFRVRDADFEYELTYRCPQAVEMVLYRWANFIRLTAFWYRGEARLFDPGELAGMRVDGSLRFLQTGS